MCYITKVIASTAFVIILFNVIKYIKNKFREIKMVKHCSGPKAYPLIGNASMFLSDLKDMSYKLKKSFVTYSSPWRFWIGPKLVLVFDDLEDIKIISDNPYEFQKSELYDFMKSYMGNGLITAPATLWNIHRKMLGPVFKRNMFSTYMAGIVKNSNTLATILETYNGENIDIENNVMQCTLNIIFESIFECDLDLQNKPELKYTEYINEGVDIVMERMIKIWLHPDLIFNNSSQGKRLRKLLSVVDNITYEIIRKKKESMKEGKILQESKGVDENNKDKNRSSFLDVLLTSLYKGGEYSEADIRDEVNTFIFTGSETSAIVIKFLFLMLATFPKIQNQAYKELQDMYGSSDNPITLEDTKKMEYLERVIKETLRLFPPAPLIGRTACRDTKVNEKLIIPKNTSVFISIFSLHRKEKYWKNPLTFNPDRFLPGNYEKRYFLPFSRGIRNCIGQDFAMLEMKTIAATVLRKFTVHTDYAVPVEDINVKFGLTLQPAEPIILQFCKR